MRLSLPPLLLLTLAGAAPEPLRSTPQLGQAEGRCRPHEPGPAILITALGLKDRSGLLRAELYPANDSDFLADDNRLLSEGKVFRRAEIALPRDEATVRLCIRAPAPGSYSLVLIHDRDGNRKFSLLHDGIGFPGNPRLGLGKPSAEAARIGVPEGLIATGILLNYRSGLFSFAPLKERR